MSAGFASVRRFNDAIKGTFRKPPRALRRDAGRASASDDEARALTLKLPFFAPYDWDGVLAFLAPRAIAGVERVERMDSEDGGAYERVVSRAASLRVTFDPRARCLRLTVRGRDVPDLIGVVARTERLFDLGADPARIARHLRRDRILAPLVVARPGLRVPGAWDGFELAVRAVLGQQVSVKGATTLAGRLVERFGARVVTARAGLTHTFPEPAVLADVDLASIGLPRARAETIRAIAVAMKSGALALDASRALEETIARLVALPGVGPWTAHYIAMRACGEPDAFPASDLGLRKAIDSKGESAGVLRARRPIDATARELEGRAEAWRPWRAYAAMHLWMGQKQKETST
jgi:AraC family transcriptional regulator of adaptative response / DNA-3-methyladenine glycosylase II